MVVAEWKSSSPICFRDHLRCGLSKCAADDFLLGVCGGTGGRSGISWGVGGLVERGVLAFECRLGDCSLEFFDDVQPMLTMLACRYEFLSLR